MGVFNAYFGPGCGRGKEADKVVRLVKDATLSPPQIDDPCHPPPHPRS